MTNICLGNLLPSSVLAYDNIDLIPNGYIPQKGTTARPRTRNQGGQIISERDVVTLLPADRLYIEFWFGISSRITGTNLADLGPGVFNTLGILGAGAGFVAGQAIGCSLLGDSEKTKSKWVFHVCESETRINREVILTKDNISTGTITFSDYVMGVLGVTRSPIKFVTPTTPLTSQQIEKAKAIPAEQVEAVLGKRVAPNELTDSDMRVLLGISELNELENLGNSHRNIRGWPQTQAGQIQANFTNYKFDDPNPTQDTKNLFVEIVRDPRKNRYRADNEYDRADGHCFWNGSTDDITDKTIKFNIETSTNVTNNTATKLKAGDKVYISYVAATKPIFRHALENITNFFLFPDQSAYQLPPLDLVKGWNFKKFKFKVRKKDTERTVLSDIINDNNILNQIDQTNSDPSLSPKQKADKIASLQKKIVLVDIECQRLIESKLERANRNTFIKGCYFADSRGILSLDLRSSNSPVLLVPRSSIRDQKWFTSFFDELKSGSPASFDANGQLIVSDANSFFDDFLFDISDSVNSVLYDNEKFGYERRLANAISKCTIYNKDTPETGVGFPNLDFIKNQTPNRNNYDLTSAKFDSVPMQGASNLFTCNVTFTYDFGFCTKGTIRADMILRTPFFLEKLGTKARVYVEKFQAQNPLRGDGGIWVGSRPFQTEKYAVTTDPFHYSGCLVYPDSNNGTTNFRVFEEGLLLKDFENLKRTDLQASGHELPPIDDSLTNNITKYGGYDKVLGDRPGFFKGSEITTENGLILMNKIDSNIIKTDKLDFTKNKDSGRLNITGISNRRLRKITIKYTPLSKNFFTSLDRTVSFVFSSSKTVIDNIPIHYKSNSLSESRFLYVGTEYINLENWFIDGDILKEMNIDYIEAESIEETEYQKYKVSTSRLSTCFDSIGNWLVFYEDEKGAEGDVSNNGKSADGSHLVGPIPPGSFPGLQEKSDKEISCLLSPDKGETWYDFKAVVRTAVGEVVGSPYSISNKNDTNVHLFYVLNSTLMHKIIDTSLFDYKDAFLGYKRPNTLDATTYPSYGLYHFSPKGIAMREETSSVVVGNSNGNYLVAQAKILDEMKAKNRKDFRIIIAGNSFNYENGFLNEDYVAYRDPSGQIKVMFIYDGKFYCRGSSDEGLSWFEFIQDGIYIHKHSKLHELKPVDFLGMVLDYKQNSSYLTYQVDGMLFVKKFDSQASSVSVDNLKNVLNPDTGSSNPVFIVGSLIPELKTAINDKGTNVIFPYKDVDVFGEGFSISGVPSFGYSTASGFLRLFYKDTAGNFRAFSYPETPILDISYGKVD